MSTKIKDALSDRVFTTQEADEVLLQAGADDVDEIVQELEIAVNSPQALDLSTTDKQTTVNDFLTKLDKVKTLPLDRAQATTPAGGFDWLSVIRLQNASGLPSGSFTGKSVAVDNSGGLVLGGVPLLVTKPADDAQIEALFALSKPNQLVALSTAQRTALTNKLFERVAQTIPSAIEPGKYRNIVAGTASLAALSQLAKGLSGAQIDTLLSLYEKTQTPLGQALILRALDAAPMSAAQKAARSALSLDVASVLLPRFDEAMTKEGLAAQVDAIGVVFGRDDNALSAFAGVARLYASVDRDGELDADEARPMLKDLEAYVDNSTQTSFVYGALKNDAPKNVAKLTNAKIVAELTPDLQAAMPSLRGVALTSEQAAQLLPLLGGIADSDAADQLVALFNEARSLFGTPADKSLPHASFTLLCAQLQQAFDRRGDSSDGMIEMFSFGDAVREAISALQTELAARLQSLSGSPASFDGIALSNQAAASVRNVLETYTRSTLTVANLGGALKVIADANGGKIEDPTQFEAIIAFYRQNWPRASVFDFNKLGRIASFMVQGKSVPLCTINGKEIPLGEFYAQVGRSVAASIDATKQEYDWMPERWGLRGKAAVELLDVIAQQTAEGRGPIVALQKANPGKQIIVHAQASDGAHDQFVFEVKGVGSFNQGSDGVIKAYRGTVANEMFSSKIAANGTFDVAVSTSPRPLTKWPLQTTYDVGDSIDVKFLDRNAKNEAVEGKRFSDQHKILPGKVEGYDAEGNYVVSYKKPDGTAVNVKVSLDEIRSTNNPHNFELTGSSFSDVEIDVSTQPHLREFIEGAKKIIAKHLPRDGSNFDLAPGELSKAQRECVEDLQHYMRPLMQYPAELDHNPDEASKKYHEIIDDLGWDTVPLDKLLEIKMGVCRHQCIIEQICMQLAGIDSRLASGAANTDSGDFRGYHIWNELSLADNARYLSDQTWDDAIIPLWNGAYDSDLRRIELYHRTAQYDGQLV